MNSPGEYRICATFTLRFEQLDSIGRVALIGPFASTPGDGWLIEGLSLDRQEKCITFFRILPTNMAQVFLT
jgi:hypothetical protein